MARPKKYQINENYFEKIDSENKAYILGIIASDGSICNGISYILAEKDIEILFFLKEQLRSEHPVKRKKYSSFIISNSKIKKDLLALGLRMNKSKNNLTFPNLEPRYIFHFLRGIFDGDGSIYENKNEFTVSFTGGESFLIIIKNILQTYDINSYLRYRYGENNKNSCMLDIRGSVQIQKIKNLLYTNAEFFLKRKYNKFLLNEKKYFNFIKRSHSKNGNKEKIIEMYNSGLKARNISEIMSIPLPSVKNIIRYYKKNNKIETFN